jgi:CRP-like cAMP-binding protein
MPEIKDSLLHFDLFTDLTDEMLAKVANLCQLESYDRYQTIVEHGSPPDKFYLIQEGTVRIFTAPIGKTQRLSDSLKITLGTGQSFGEMGLIDSGARSATVKAITETKLIVIDCDQFRELIETDVNLGYQIMKNIAIDLSFKLRYRNLI